MDIPLEAGDFDKANFDDPFLADYLQNKEHGSKILKCYPLSYL